MTDQSTSTPSSDTPTLEPNSASTTKGRGPTTCRNLKKKKATEQLSVQFDQYGRVIGPYATKFVSYIGSLVRSQVDINIKSWRDVDAGLKNIIWEDVKKEFDLQDDSRKSNVLKIASLRWKQFKSRLIRDYVNNKHPKYKSPIELYDFLDEDQWIRFVAGRQTEEFKEKTKKAREMQALNKHPHLLGSGGYAKKRQEWMQSDPLSSQSPCASVSSSLMSDDRSFDWIRARTKKADDGSYFIPNEKTQEVFHKIVEKCEEINQGTFEPKRHHDILSTVLGKEDHPGSVRGVGSYSTIQGVFGRPDRKMSTSGEVFTVDVVKEMMNKCRQDIVTEMEAKMQPKIDSFNQQLQFLLKNISATHLFPHGVSDEIAQSVYTPCDLPLCDPPPTRSSCYSVDTYPVTTTKSLPKQNKNPRDQSGELSGIGIRPPIVGDDVLQHLGDNCKYLVMLLTPFPLHKDFIELDIDQAIFHHTNTTSIFVMMDDIKDLMTMHWLNVSIIQVFILFLNQLCNQLQVTSIGFVCPTQISKDMVVQNPTAVTSYFVHLMKQHHNKQFILAPYHQESHWLLLVICIHSKMVYVLDPLPCDRYIEIKAILNVAFRSAPSNGRVRSINWKQCKCPIQPGSVECGYYVMRYMFDIVTKYSSIDCLDEAFQSNNPYSINEVNEIQELWAKYFVKECI